MKKKVNGAVFDTDSSTAKATYTNKVPEGLGRIDETAYLTSFNQYFVVRKVDGVETELFPMSTSDMGEWSNPQNKPGDFTPSSKK